MRYFFKQYKMDLVNFNILLYSDYEDVLNLCRSSPIFFRICRNPYFWQEKAYYDFGVLPEHLALIQGRNNKARYEWIMNISPNNGLEEAAKIGSLELVKYFIAQGANNYNWAMGD